ncbi:MAG TPA: hypothetical protein VGS19_21745 [Streptosporangiaceae bacterium]|nr:hypothetical protein [Streptosporangiaceae bacterium]
MNKTAKGPRVMRSSDAFGFLARARPASLDHGPADLTAGHIGARHAAIASAAPDRDRGRVRVPWVRWVALAGAGLAVTAGAAAVGASLSAGSAPSPAVLTAALVRQAASVSRSEFAVSGEATIGYRSHGLTSGRGTDQIAFAGKNWDFRSSWVAPAAAGHPGTAHHVINRVVNGRAYYDIPARNGRLTWYEDTSAGAAYRLHIPDPRSLLNLLTPAAGFQFEGYQTIGGVRCARLRATRTAGLGSLSELPEAQPGERVTALEVWVDRRGIVHRMDLTLRGVAHTWHLTHRGILAMARKHHPLTPDYLRQLVAHGEAVTATQPEATVLSVTFSRIGQPQHISAPAHSIRVRGQG